jgi:hypothetical protein
LNQIRESSGPNNGDENPKNNKTYVSFITEFGWVQYHESKKKKAKKKR